MGQEIDHIRFEKADFKRFYRRLKEETALLKTMIEDNSLSQNGPIAGFEIEAWLIDKCMEPAPVNDRFLEVLNDSLACTELAKFNIELNNDPVLLNGKALSLLEQDLNNSWAKACLAADSIDTHLTMIGTLPTLKQSDLILSNMSDLNRYRALNEQILRLRGKPIRIDISGNQHLKIDHDDVMMESAATSFQIHIQTPLERAHHIYNSAIIASAPLVAVCANAPFLFGRDLWSETRIPLFEQSIEVGGYAGVAHGPLRRVSFGSGYARKSIMECFDENFEHFPILLPSHFDSEPEAFDHLRLHNGTIWRWNRPLVGFDQDGTPHIRIEHRVIPAGPSIKDMIANAAFFYGLAEILSTTAVQPEPIIPFSQAKDNFYLAARQGLNAQICWLDGHKHNVRTLILNALLPLAEQGLFQLGMDSKDVDNYLDVIRERASSKQNGCEWQRQYFAGQKSDFFAMTRTYLKNQQTGRPVHLWDLS